MTSLLHHINHGNHCFSLHKLVVSLTNKHVLWYYYILNAQHFLTSPDWNVQSDFNLLAELKLLLKFFFFCDRSVLSILELPTSHIRQFT